jgi:hypothetical protein
MGLLNEWIDNVVFQGGILMMIEPAIGWVHRKQLKRGRGRARE